VAKRLTALVRGPSPVVPRDFLWVVPLWYGCAAVAISLFGRLPSWYLPAALGTLLLAALVQLTVLLTMRDNAFAADANGITLGLRGGARRRLGRRRRQLFLPWGQIRELYVARRHYGTRLVIIMNPDAPAARPPNLAASIVATAVALVLPVAYLVRCPGLLRARRDPPRYSVPLQEIGVQPLHGALAELAGPAGVPVLLAPRRVPRRRAAAPQPTAVRLAGGSAGQGPGPQRPVDDVPPLDDQAAQPGVQVAPAKERVDLR